jgi:hypothetical protein
MTDGQEADLRAIIEVLRDSHDADWFARQSGEAHPSQRHPGGHAVELSGPHFGRLDIRPWSVGSTGVVDITLRAGDVPMEWDSVVRRFGPFEPMQFVDSRAAWFRAFAPTSAAGSVPVLIMCRVASGNVETITLRRDPD